jgi:hypothetical protein
MMNTQSLTVHPGLAESSLKTLRAGRVMALGSAGGRLEVLRGRVWLTREGDLDDHVVASGESLRIAPNGSALVEAWDDEDPALVAWWPGTVFDRLSAYLRSSLSRGWEIVDPAPRISAGTVAALLALFVGAAVFGPFSDSRSKALAAPAVLHNTAGFSAPLGVAAHDREGIRSDAGAATPGRARFVAQEARRRSAVPA